MKDDDNHPLLEEIKRMIEIEMVNATPAQVAEELMRSEDVDEALEGVLKLLRKKKEIMDNNEQIVVANEGEDDIVVDDTRLNENA